MKIPVMIAALIAVLAGSVDCDQSEQPQEFVRRTENPAASAAETGTAITQSRQNAITRAVEKVSPAVVGISTTGYESFVRRRPLFEEFFNFPFTDFYRNEMVRRKVSSLGSGFIISPDGYIVTNSHVVDNADEITVTLANGGQHKAEFVGESPESDIALLKIEGEDFPHAELGDSDDLIVGEWVIAFGNPFGLFDDVNNQPSITVGVISGINRDFGMFLENHYYDDMIQTDAAINSGNSGGPLVNSLGRIIGVNTFIITGSGDRGSSGVGFAIPIDKVKTQLEALKAQEGQSRPYYTGIRSVVDVTERHKQQFGLSEAKGALITAIDANSPAHQAGLLPLDVIVGVNGEEIDKKEDILEIIDESNPRPGREVQFTIVRNGQLYRTTVVLGQPSRKKEEN